MTAASITLASADGLNHTVLSGALILALPIALLGGLVSFFSPCVLPLVPGYLSYMTGAGGADLAQAKRGRLLAGSVLFVLGFSVPLVSAGALFGYAGRTLQEYKETIAVVLGIVMILLGLVFMGLLNRFGQRDVRFRVKTSMGLLGAPLLGLGFGVGWTPCIGPTLASVNALNAYDASATRAAVLTFAYCLGLGLPFIVAALAFRRALGAFGWVKKHYAWVMRIGGGMLVAVGLLLVTGAWDYLVQDLQTWTSEYNPGI
ncbi:cytochrome c biogenesis CcdA family protein [Streptomyces caatingaensis]|uniref:Cytochrome C biogenesis protein ResC n=1 Tax=Streptomyces caatingaensis TaxID=1678637 RepID=A0A0K9XBH5_9ACTN|nr:cytochrome c biogenesis protein CcdA [Streptomyces caatingaensis]KNB50012.1 cytochrome C biogenesis protein ResC [Streptomyces caatingaensis]